MPIISRFYGIVIAMYFRDHAPPHVHAKYAGCEGLFRFDGALLEGNLPVRAQKIVQEWMRLHEAELQDNWQRAQTGQELQKIAPLE